MITPQEALQRTIEHREIFHDEMLHLMRLIMKGEITPVMAAAILTGLRVKKETIGEIAAAATVMRELCTPVVVPDNPRFVDIVGTGGDSAHTFNISTASAFVVAAIAASAFATLCFPGSLSQLRRGSRSSSDSVRRTASEPQSNAPMFPLSCKPNPNRVPCHGHRLTSASSSFSTAKSLLVCQRRIVCFASR